MVETDKRILQPWQIAATEQQIARREGQGYDVLAEVLIIRDSLVRTENGFEIPKSAQQYIYYNEKTAALEAATKGAIYVTYQKWDKNKQECSAYGESVVNRLERGVEAARENNLAAFEQQRRQTELLDAIEFNNAIADGILSQYDKITISPFPEDVDPQIARQYGYDGAMIRHFHLADGTDIVETHQINVKNSNVPAFVRLVRKLTGDEDYSISLPVELLGSQIYVRKDRLKRGIIDVAQMYDNLLLEEREDISNRARGFFLGEEVPLDSKRYGLLFEKTQTTENQIEPLIQHLVETDVELAISLTQGKPTQFIERKICQYLEMRNKRETLNIDFHQRTRLYDSLEVFTEQSARKLKELELIRVWSVIASLANKERAAELFGKEQVVYVCNQFSINPAALLHGGAMNDIVARTNQQVMFIACGGMIGDSFGGFGPINLFELPLQQAIDVLFSPVPVIDSEPFECPNCHKKTHGPVGNSCPKCGITKEEAERQGLMTC